MRSIFDIFVEEQFWNYFLFENRLIDTSSLEIYRLLVLIYIDSTPKNYSRHPYRESFVKIFL